jgi:CheY-like chemotaxis protein
MNTGPTILIVDDDDGHALLIQQNLEEAGLLNSMEHLCDGQAIVDFFKAGPDRGRPVKAYIILLDIRMPKLDGIEVLRLLKSNRDLRTIPIFIVTTSDDRQDIERCYTLGCNGYIVKPVTYSLFSDAIRALGRFTQILSVPPLDEERDWGLVGSGRGQDHV